MFLRTRLDGANHAENIAENSLDAQGAQDRLSVSDTIICDLHLRSVRPIGIAVAQPILRMVVPAQRFLAKSCFCAELIEYSSQSTSRLVAGRYCRRSAYS